MAASAVFAQNSPSWTPPDPATKDLALSIFRQIIDINSTDSVGSVTAVSKALQQRFLDAGFPAADIFLGGPNDRKENLVVKTGPPIHFSSSRKTATITDAARRT
jgi:hypothetical protein